MTSFHLAEFGEGDAGVTIVIASLGDASVGTLIGGIGRKALVFLLPEAIVRARELMGCGAFQIGIVEVYVGRIGIVDRAETIVDAWLGL